MWFGRPPDFSGWIGRLAGFDGLATGILRLRLDIDRTGQKEDFELGKDRIVKRLDECQGRGLRTELIGQSAQDRPGHVWCLDGIVALRC